MADSERIFKNQLTMLDMLSSKGKQTTGFYFVKEKPENASVRISLEEAERYEADAVFFRMFPDEKNRSPLPQVYIYHNTTLDLDVARYAEIHRRLWNAGVVPLVFIFTATEVRVLNCRREPDINHNNKPRFSPFSSLEDLLKVDQAFITRDIATGTFWENPKFKNDFALERTAYHKLLLHLKSFRKNLLEQKKLSVAVTNRLLVMAILVKYLSDRQDVNGNKVFQRGFFSQFSNSGQDDLASLFSERGSCVKLFKALSAHFNGGIFELTADEEAELAHANLNLIAEFLKGTLDPFSGQGIFWPLYSFQDLPIELISNIYEEFLAKKDDENSNGVVYTPPMLVDFLLDNCLPLHPDTLKWKILDPACGSGVFLVGAYKRLIHCWRLAKNWELPTLADLKNLLKNNIFGFDEKHEAVLITAFSLCVALCDELEPRVIWEKLKFDDLLQCNLLSRDFFEIIESGVFDNHFDLVIGNPPFESTLTTLASKRIEATSAKERPEIPDQQLALLFYEQSFRLCRKVGKVCLIQPAGPLLYNVNGQPFRKYLFNKFHTNNVLDFTALEGVLFTKVQVAAAAVIGTNCTPSMDKVLHITFRRTKAIKEKLLFELDPYDFHWISRESISKNRFVWKANLLGGGRLHRLLQRFVDAPTLEAYLEQKRTNEGWQFGEGYSVGCGRKLNEAPNKQELVKLSPEERKKQYRLKRTPKTAYWITGMLDVPPSALTRDGLDWNYVRPCEKVFFQDTSTSIRSIFSKPHVLIREVVEGVSIPAFFTDKELVFSKQIIGVYAPKKDRAKLQELATRLNDSGLYGVLAAAISGRMLVSRATSLLKRDIFALPYPKDDLKIDLNYWETALIEDIGNYLIEFRREGEDATILNTVDDADLANFGNMYCRILNPVYEKFRPLHPMRLGSFICFPFCYADAPTIELPEDKNAIPFLEQLLHRQLGSRLFVNRILRLYDQNCIFMIKPNQKRYWLRSIAFRDADETLIDLFEQGY
jgi:type I restriction-modification system DNA methylase subunit